MPIMLRGRQQLEMTDTIDKRYRNVARHRRVRLPQHEFTRDLRSLDYKAASGI